MGEAFSCRYFLSSSVSIGLLSAFLGAVVASICVPNIFLAFAQAVRPSIAEKMARDYPNRIVTFESGEPRLSGPCSVTQDSSGYVVLFPNGVYRAGSGNITDSGGAYRVAVRTPSAKAQSDAFRKIFRVMRQEVCQFWRKDSIVRKAEDDDRAIHAKILADVSPSSSGL